MPNTLDITKTAKEILFDKLNFVNGLNLKAIDFDLSVPVALTPAVLLGHTYNTKITCTPTLDSRYYGSRDIFYSRLDISDVLANPNIEILPGIATKLSEIIPQINTAYGIELKPEDYFEQDIPAFDSANPTAIRRVSVAIKTTSLLFTGNHSLLLGARSNNPTVNNVTRRIYIFNNNYTTSDYLKTFIVLNTLNEIDSTFNLLANANNITNFTITKFFVKNNGEIVLNGLFSFGILDANITETQVTNALSITLNADGTYKSFQNTYAFSQDQTLTYEENSTVNFKYVIDNTDTVSPTRLYRYSQDGTKDTSYTVTGITYKPEVIALTQDGKLYTVSPVFTGPVVSNNNVVSPQIRVDRLNADGTLDTGFNPIELTSAQSGSPVPVVQILPTELNGFYLLLLPLYGVGNNATTNKINGQPFNPPNETNAYAINPVLKFSQAGIWDRTFNNLLKLNLDKSIYIPAGSPLAVRNKVLLKHQNKLTFFTYKTNPITGFDHVQPITFNDIGTPLFLSGLDYLNQFRWTDYKGSFVLASGEILAYGRVMPILNTGEYGSPVSCVVKYNSFGVASSLVYRNDVITLGQLPLVTDVQVKETVV